jgi:hypothetical protein
VRHAAKTPELFSSAHGIFLHDAKTGTSVAAELFGDAGEQIRHHRSTSPSRAPAHRIPTVHPVGVERLLPGGGVVL